MSDAACAGCRCVAPGGTTDTFARLMAQKLTDQFGKQFYVENIRGRDRRLGQSFVENPCEPNASALQLLFYN